MKKNRRDFLKLTSLSGISLVGASMMPGYPVVQNKNKQTSLNDGPTQKTGSEMPTEPLDPAPEWLQNADMITDAAWEGYDIEFEAVWVEKTVRWGSQNVLKKIQEQIPVIKNGIFDGSSIKGVPLISHAPVSEIAFEQAHGQGFRVIPYVHFKDIHTFYADQDIFPFQHPEVLLKDEEGKWVNILMDGTYRFNRFLTCTNNPVYCKLSLAYIKKIMDWGADGLFIDNVDHRQECFAPNYTIKDPEFAPYIHEHIYPEHTSDYAYNRFLESVYKLVKSYGDDKVVVINSAINLDFKRNADCCMWESLIYGWSWEGRRPEDSWDNIKKRAAENEWYTKSGRRFTALSNINPLRQEAKEDAFWAFSAARLVDFIWWANLKGTGAEMLYQAHLGKVLSPLKDEIGLSFRIYENGIIVLNDNKDDRSVEIELPDSFHQSQLLDLYNNSNEIPVRNGKVKVSIPKDCARVYVLSSKKG